MKLIFDIFQRYKKHKILASNFVYLSLLQGLNLLLPLITFPYLIRVLGVEYFGLLSFSFAFITYFQIVTDYGFNATGTRDISLVVDDFEKQNLIFNQIMSAKLVLVVLSFIVMMGIVFSFEIFRNYWIIYLFSFGSILGQAIFPVWYFQGIQKMKYITYLNLATKLIFTIALFVFVRQKSDYYLVPVFNALGFITAGVFALFYIQRDFNIKFKLQSLKGINEQLHKSKYVFLSELKISLFTNTNTLILGILAGNHAVGYFSAAEKLVRAIGNFQTPISNTIFPYLSKEMTQDKLQTIQKIKKITILGTVLFSIIIIICFCFAEQIIEIIYGKAMFSSVLIFRILILIPLLSFLDTMYGKQILLNLGRDHLYFRVIVFATILNLAINFILTNVYQELGTAITLIITQIFIVLGMWYFANKEVKLIIKTKEP
ncbi:Putative O-antigen transporter [Flavobacterium bizetiae]|uniref:O-antigen transporter n=1 Tax=Flavobacterium bizetiae TaxID=2704140 RepID=A0A6J4GWQ9_9FLAO|nr:flippase [Flavobacterium bizetiae]CAA9203754.1 Putative O-antigen transporter [Flavobacterium bizetiae]CAD5343897.1 Putative O-antigen transporter [Flavobacterium bizetiae]CAD5349668.1 Putative O-antigen transporter [Flavobacterium bizetiae]